MMYIYYASSFLPRIRLRVGMPEIRLHSAFGRREGLSPARLALAVARDLAQHQPALPVVVEFLSL